MTTIIWWVINSPTDSMSSNFSSEFSNTIELGLPSHEPNCVDDTKGSLSVLSWGWGREEFGLWGDACGWWNASDDKEDVGSTAGDFALDLTDISSLCWSGVGGTMESSWVGGGSTESSGW